jgi:Glutathione S-transferase
MAELDQEEAEAVDADAQSHDGDGRADPGQDGALVGEVLGDVMQFRLLFLQAVDVGCSHASLLALLTANIARDDRALEECTSETRLLPASPYVRKVTACAIKRGLNDKIERLKIGTTDPALLQYNALSKVPTLITDDGACFSTAR